MPSRLRQNRPARGPAGFPAAARIPVYLALSIGLAAIVAAFGGCSSADDTPGPNVSPSAAIGSGPVEGSVSDYRIRIWWTGSDVDGYIDRFEYALDPPAGFTETEIARGGPGVTTEILPGEDGSQGRTRVSKLVDGAVISFDWIHTRDFSRRFAFSTTKPDSSEGPGGPVPEPRFFGTHAFYVRSVDDDGAMSAPARVGFTASSVTPVTRITSPTLPDDFLTLGEDATFSWDSLDPDAPGGPGPAVSYQYKLVRLDELDLIIFQDIDPGEIMYERTAGIPWVATDETSVSLRLEVPATYLFSVRAVDAAGAIEPFLGLARSPLEPANSVKFRTQAGASRPTLCVMEPILAAVCGTGRRTVEVSVPVDVALSFEWSASAENYGGVIEKFSYGVDVSDPDDPTQYVPWTTLGGPAEPIVFDEAGFHNIVFQVRDTFGNLTRIEYLVEAVDMPGDRKVLIIDDVRDGVWPRDGDRDGFWTDLLAESDRFEESDLVPAVSRFDSHGDDDRFFAFPVVPDLGDLGRYRTVVIDSKAAGFNGVSGLLRMVTDRTLSAYSRAGGNLWVLGEQTIASMGKTPSGTADLVYPKEIAADDLACTLFRLCGAVAWNQKYTDSDRSGLIAVDPWNEDEPVLPRMEIDWDKIREATRFEFGLGGCDALLSGPAPPENGILEPLYAFRALGPTLDPPEGTSYDGLLTAIRWHDPDPAAREGRLIWFGFPMYFFRDDQAQETFNRSIDWFREQP